ncbi:kinesin-like protein KIF9 [Engystomops pustulosus]|uniref:kinesin-like protein KIF9 n=1 Tax=Engystomops pustulosus TaxID=76066 RepID=UPI003AFA246C
MIPMRKLLSLGEDDQERFDKLQQELLVESPGSLPFNNARIKSDRQHNYARGQAQLPPTRKKPGVITSNVKNKPPSMLTAA